MSWQDLLQLIGLLIPVISGMATGIWWCVKRHLDALKRCDELQKQVEVVAAEKEKLQKQVEKGPHGTSSETQSFIVRLQELVRKYRKDIEEAEQKHRKAIEEAEQKHAVDEKDWRDLQRVQIGKIAQLNVQLRAVTAQAQQTDQQWKQARIGLNEKNKEIAALQAQIKSALDHEGRIWERPLPATATPFQPLSARKMPIVSILNLKGGVGKTTITANLAALLGLQGARVLLVDLDYQRSLTLLCCSSNQLKVMHLSRCSLQHFLLDPQPDAKRLLECATPIEGADNCSIVGNTDPNLGSGKGDNLEDAEMYLLAQWLTRSAGPDIRLTLRQALHSPLIREKFDYVLLDCPPRLSTACLNGLAASDFAVIPVMLDYTSTNSAPNLLRKLRRLREQSVLTKLNVLGVLANRVSFFKDKAISAQAVVWSDLSLPCQAAWQEKVYFFDTMIKQSSAVADASERHNHGKATCTFAAYSDELKPIFHNLLQEMRKRIDYECQRFAAIPSQSAPAVGGQRLAAANPRRA